MKTFLLYGVAWALTGFVLMVVLYLLGFHSDPEKLTTAQVIGGVAGLGIAITCIVLGTKARRREIPATEEFGYSRAFGAGLMVSVVAALCAVATSFAYVSFVNPEFTDVIVQAQVQKMEEKRVPAEHIERAEKMIRTMSGPAVQAIMGCVGTLVFGTIISLISAAVMKREAVDEPPSLPATG